MVVTKLFVSSTADVPGQHVPPCQSEFIRIASGMQSKTVSVGEPLKELPTAEETSLDFTASPTDADLRCPFYCEENVWRLAYRKMRSSQSHRHGRDYFVAFISNERKSVPMFYQRAASDEETPCVWDYHVILIEVDTENSNNMQVYDVDTTLTPYPIALEMYTAYSFPDELSSTTFAPLFRVIPATKYLEFFQSDRSHMYNAHTSSWSAPPPSYQCIFQSPSPSSNADRTRGTRSNLKHYLNFGSPPLDQEPIPVDAFGVILTLEQLRLGEFRNE